MTQRPSPALPHSTAPSHAEPRMPAPRPPVDRREDDDWQSYLARLRKAIRGERWPNAVDSRRF